MRKFHIFILLAFFLSGFAWAQEEQDSTEVQTEVQAEAPEDVAADGEEEVDDSDLDEQT